MPKFFILLFILSSLLCGSKERVRLDVLDWDVSVVYEFSIPKREHKEYCIETTDVGGIGKTYVYEFDEGATLYITNSYSLLPSECTNARQPIVGDAIMRLILPDGYSRSTEGHLDSGYYREWESLDVCIGYKDVAYSQKKEFDAAVNSLKAIKTYREGSDIEVYPHHQMFLKRVESDMGNLTQAFLLSNRAFEKADSILVVSHYGVLHSSWFSFYAYIIDKDRTISSSFHYSSMPSRSFFECKQRYLRRLSLGFYQSEVNDAVKDIVERFKKGELSEASELWSAQQPNVLEDASYHYSIFVRRNGVLRKRQSGHLGFWNPPRT